VDIGGEFCGRRIPIRGLFGEACRRDRFEARTEAAVTDPKPPRRRLPHDPGGLGQRTACHIVGKRAGEKLVEDHPERIDIRARVDHAAIALFRARVLPRAHEHTGLSEAPFLIFGQPGHAEVDHLRLACGIDENVGGLQIPVHDASRMAEADRVAHGGEQRESLPRGESHSVTGTHQRFTIGHVFHHEIGRGLAGNLAGTSRENLGDPRVPQAAEEFRLSFEPLAGRG
jgi:hypothetical protein